MIRDSCPGDGVIKTQHICRCPYSSCIAVRQTECTWIRRETMGIKGKYFLIVSEATGLVLDVKGSGTSPGTEVIMWGKTCSDNQIWYEDPVTGTIRNKHNNLCLDLSCKCNLFWSVYSQQTVYFTGTDVHSGGVVVLQ